MSSDSNQEFVLFGKEENRQETENNGTETRKSDQLCREDENISSARSRAGDSERTQTSRRTMDSLDLMEFEKLVIAEQQNSITPDSVSLVNEPAPIEDTKPTLEQISDEYRSFKFSFSYVSDEQSTQQSEEEVISEPSYKEVETKIDRSMYYELHSLYTQKCHEEKMKNNYLQTRLVEYYNRRRMYHVFHTDKYINPDYQKRYERILSELERIYEDNAREEEAIQTEVESLRFKCRYQKESVQQLFEKMQKDEKDFAKELSTYLDDKDKANAAKRVEYLLRRQKHGIDDLSKIRLKYIKLSNNYNQVQQMMNALDKLGSNFRVADYEQLKNDNKTLLDRLEEKELQLTTIRKKCQNAMQIMAHLREKVDAINTQIESETDRLETVSDECLDIREQLTDMKNERDYYRGLIKKLKDDAGLLSRPKLLRDMEQSIYEIKDLKTEVERCKKEYATSTELLRAIRKGSSSILLDDAELKYSFSKNIVTL